MAAVDSKWLEISPFVEVTQRLRRERGWVVSELACTHNFLARGPESLLPLLLAEA